MKILSVGYNHVWSWNLKKKYLLEALPEHEFCNVESKEALKIDFNPDVILLEHPTQASLFNWRKKIVARIGGWRPFDGDLARFDSEMQSVFAVIALSKGLYDISRRQNPNSYLIPDGLDLVEWRPVRRKFVSKPVIGFCGNIIREDYRKQKGYDLVEQACKQLSLPLKAALYKTGQIPYDEIYEKFYSEIDILVHPTETEGCSGVIMEALAAARPVITTRAAGFHGEKLTDGENVLFVERDVDDVVEKIRMLQNDRQLYRQLSENGRKFAEKYHDIKITAALYNLIFESCLNHQMQRPYEDLPLFSRQAKVAAGLERPTEKRRGYIPLHGR